METIMARTIDEIIAALKVVRVLACGYFGIKIPVMSSVAEASAS
jgi:hypothetical protein